MVVSASELKAQAALLDRQTGGANARADEGVLVPSGRANFPIVAVGASAGGLDAATRLIDALPDAPGMAFILIQHLDPTHKSLMAELLAKHTPMPVVEARDGAAIEIDHVYTIPSGAYLSVSGDVLRLSPPETPRGVRKPFDFLLKSLARGTEHPIAAIILSGFDGDGSDGLPSIRERGGLVLAQDPAEAEQNSMPISAIDTGLVDQTLRIGQMPHALALFAKSNAASATTSPPGLAAIIEELRRKTPHDFRLYKPGTLLRRIERRMALVRLGPGAMPDYLALLRKDAGERDLLAADLLINVTTFFRDPKTFALLESKVIPDLIAHHGTDEPLRVWVAGCSTGEEAYSIAILFLEAIAAAKRPIKLQMFASDVDAEAVAKAREGIYPASITVDITTARLKRFFVVNEAGDYRVNPDLRGAIVFTVQDLLSDPPFSRLDLISCRNVLIYLTPRAQAKVIALFHFALRKRGVLLLGSAESIGSMAGRFETVAKAERIYRQVGHGRLGLSDFAVAAAADKTALARTLPDKAQMRASGFADLARRTVLETHAPAAVLIDRAGKCLYSLGATDRYLQVASGYPTHDLLEMATPALRAKLRSAIGRVGPDTPRVFIGHSRIGSTAFGIDVQSVKHDGEELLLVAFIDDPEHGSSNDAKTPATNARVGDLEHELALTRDELRIALEGLETSSQEQKAINEEALSVNEEYQSTNEELLTSKEELQSLNEELTALNGQLQETLERQRSTSDDLQNVLYSTDVATLFLDPDLCIRFFTPATRAVFNVIPGDIGRPLADLRSLAVDDRLTDDARAVLKGSAPIGQEIEVPGGSWFLRRVLPYHTHDAQIEGVVITFTDITERKNSAKALRASKREAELANVAKSRFLAAASHDLRQPLQSLALVQALLVHSVEGDKVGKLVTRLGQTIDAMTGMLNVLLDINQIEAGVVEPQPMDFALTDLFARLRDEFTYQAQAQRLDLRVLPSTASVHSDPRLLEQMIRNLLANAMKYTRTGRILLGCRRAGQHLRIEIWDTGIGIAKADLTAIFDEFHQIDNAARERSKGLGLGLSIVQRLGALLGHDVNVRSRLGRGSAFTIDVPLAQRAAAAPTADLSGGLEAGAARVGKIIIVEDDPEVRDLLEQLLTAGGHRVRKAANGEAAIALIAKGAIRPDLVLTDYNLPGALDGLDVLSGIRAVLRDPIPGIILTGDISDATEARIAANDCALLSKPVKSALLAATIAALLVKAKVPAIASLDKSTALNAVIILIDDDADVRLSIRDVLEDVGHVVEDYPDAESYLATVRTEREGCILLDAGLRGMSGIALLERLHATGDPMPTIMLAGSRDVTLAVAAMKAGACDFIAKPVSREALLESVARAVAQSHGIGVAHARQEAAARHMAELTPRQREIMDMVLDGQPSKIIAADLGISQRTVENHRAAIMHRMEAKSLPELARRALAAKAKASTIEG
ncbi:CheR family methyltransferase [Sphingomonas psychrolutea]|uniref:histidine kinase n=1 Tax=Sphingomonas psychrolutea TaxID=1259676 RepID=A0ABQ1H218_9SPHN|nr:CheR family methyltransferase [Sphingomonas psychrolutea]GGA55089.1 protein-glutamate methylesterase [Sphingomonas psychrolutea]